jgi:hypothetical protein
MDTIPYTPNTTVYRYVWSYYHVLSTMVSRYLLPIM